MGSLAKLAGFRLSEWNWKENYYQFGYLQVTCMKLAQLRFDPPYGYSDQAVADLAEEVENASTTDSTLPNLILIVNESWFDWRQVTEFTTDQPVTPYLDSLIESDSVVHGFTVGPLYASGTSTTEYELLTSNSTSMFPSVTPFTQQNLTSVNSLPRYLSALGYANASFHPASPQNYNRSTAYPALGFENSYWWNWEDYNSLNDAGLLSNDPYAFHGGLSDLSCFEVMEHLFEQRDSSQPLFLYNLTTKTTAATCSSTSTAATLRWTTPIMCACWTVSTDWNPRRRNIFPPFAIRTSPFSSSPSISPKWTSR